MEEPDRPRRTAVGNIMEIDSRVKKKNPLLHFHGSTLHFYVADSYVSTKNSNMKCIVRFQEDNG